jgi:hypothetical protein
MTKPDLIAYNESLARQKIQIAYINDGLIEAMKLCQLYMGLSTQEAYAKVKEMCEI